MTGNCQIPRNDMTGGIIIFLELPYATTHPIRSWVLGYG